MTHLPFFQYQQVFIYLSSSTVWITVSSRKSISLHSNSFPLFMLIQYISWFQNSLLCVQKQLLLFGQDYQFHCHYIKLQAVHKKMVICLSFSFAKGISLLHVFGVSVTKNNMDSIISLKHTSPDVCNNQLTLTLHYIHFPISSLCGTVS